MNVISIYYFVVVLKNVEILLGICYDGYEIRLIWCVCLLVFFDFFNVGEFLLCIGNGDGIIFNNFRKKFYVFWVKGYFRVDLFSIRVVIYMKLYIRKMVVESLRYKGYI